MSDLRESGAIEQDATLFVLIAPPPRRVLHQGSLQRPGVAEIIIGKQRNGSTGTCKLTFLKPLTSSTTSPWHRRRRRLLRLPLRNPRILYSYSMRHARRIAIVPAEAVRPRAWHHLGARASSSARSTASPGTTAGARWISCPAREVFRRKPRSSRSAPCPSLTGNDSPDIGFDLSINSIAAAGTAASTASARPTHSYTQPLARPRLRDAHRRQVNAARMVARGAGAARLPATDAQPGSATDATTSRSSADCASRARWSRCWPSASMRSRWSPSPAWSVISI